MIVDGDLDTEWNDGPQKPGQWVVIDVGGEREVGGVTESLGEFARDFSRRQAVDVSIDGEHWDEVWQGTTAAQAFLAAVRGPREAAVRIAFPTRPRDSSGSADRAPPQSVAGCGIPRQRRRRSSLSRASPRPGRRQAPKLRISRCPTRPAPPARSSHPADQGSLHGVSLAARARPRLALSWGWRSSPPWST